MNVDDEAISEFLTLGYLLDGKTFEKGRQYKPENTKPPELNTRSDVTIADVKKVLDEYFMRFNGEKVAVLLSGGKDSRLIVEMCNSLGLDTTAITFGYKKDSRENIVAEKVCSLLGIPHIFLGLKLEIYSKQNLRESVTFFRYDPSSSPSSVYYYYKDIFSRFDVVFTGEFITHSLREERFYQPANNVKRLLRATTFDNIVCHNKREEIKEKLISKNIDKSLNEIALNKIKNTRFKRFDITKNLFNLECPAMDENVLNTMWSLPEIDIVKKIFKKYDFKTYNLPCTRSPFPLWFPWVIHYGYRYIKNFMEPVRGKMVSNIGMGRWCGYHTVRLNIWKDLAERFSLPHSLDLEFLDHDVVETKIKELGQGVDHVGSIKRLIKLKIWLEEIA